MQHLSRSRHFLSFRAKSGARAAAALVTLLLSSPAISEIGIGLAAPLSGHMAPMGRAMQEALETAIAELNAAGGVNGASLTLTVADDGCAGAPAEGAAATLIASGVALVIGHPCSGAATKAARLYRESGVLLIAVGARHPDVTRENAAGPVVLRLAGRDDRQGEAAARWLLARAPERRVAIVHDRTAYARAIAASAKAALQAAGVERIALLPIVAGNRDYSGTIAEIRATRAEAVLFAGFADEAAILAAGLAAQGPAIPLLGTDTLATPGFADVARDARIPIQVLLPVEPRPRAGDHAHRDAAPETETHPASAAHAQGALEAWVAAVRRIAGTDAAAAGRALREAPVETKTLGALRFDDNGDLVSEAFVPASAHGGRWVRER